MDTAEYIEKLYGIGKFSPCPFTVAEISEMTTTKELLIYLPAKWTSEELCDRFGIRSNVCFSHERMIRNVMTNEDQWFIASANKTPELIFKSAAYAAHVYEREGLHGMDLRRYLAFSATFRMMHGSLPDNTYWTFLLSGSYDRSGISIVGFDTNEVLSHHGWMRNFKSKFCGSRYVVLAPRIEITPETATLSRAYRGKGANFDGQEAAMD